MSSIVDSYIDRKNTVSNFSPAKRIEMREEIVERVTKWWSKFQEKNGVKLTDDELVRFHDLTDEMMKML